MQHDQGPKDHEGRRIDFGRTAVDYERYRPGFPPSFFDTLMDRGWIAAGERAVDLGTGTGSVALGLAERHLDVTGVDISPELLVVATEAAVDRGLSAQFREARAESTGLPSSSYDLVTAGQCWWWFDGAAVIEEAHRILRPGGRVIICDFSYLVLAGNVAESTEALILEYNPRWPKAGWRGIHPEQVEALDRGGLTDVESFSYVTNVAFTHESWRGRIRTCNGVGSALEDREVESFDAALADLLAGEFPGDLAVPHRIFATTGTTA